MEKSTYDAYIEAQKPVIEQICRAACLLHDSVNQTYGDNLPYGYHLRMVADIAMRHAYSIVESADDILPVVFGAYFHDSIEDARLTYNDVKKTAARYMNARQALMAAEIVYALTNEKGRTRQERANDKYYSGIRSTPYAPFLKLCDRRANFAYSNRAADKENCRMRDVYTKEMPHFIQSITTDTNDVRLHLPEELLNCQ